MTAPTPRPYADVLKAWADGKQVEAAYIGSEDWRDYKFDSPPHIHDKGVKWRIKRIVVDKYNWVYKYNNGGYFVTQKQYGTREEASRSLLLRELDAEVIEPVHSTRTEVVVQ